MKLTRWGFCIARLSLVLTLTIGLSGVQALPSALAQTTTQDVYLHGSGGMANPPTLFVDLAAPTSGTTKSKDSAGVNVSGGNAWKLVGSWTPPAGASASGTLLNLSPVHVWLGLKNSDDQGTRFDLYAQVAVNGTSLSSGVTRCVVGLTRNANQAQEVTVVLSAFAPRLLAVPDDQVTLNLWTRVGTNADNSFCGGHSSATGLRLYFDSTTRPARLGGTVGTVNPQPTSLAPNPLTIEVGATGTLTATLTPPSTVAGQLTVTSADPAIATVPATIPFGANQPTVPIPVTAAGLGTTQITATLNGGTVSSTVTVTPLSPTIASLAPPATSITQGASGTLTVTISAAQSSPTTVTLTSNASGIAFVPSSVTVPANQTSAPIPVSANTPGTAQITASLNGTSASSTVTVTPALPSIAALQPPVLPLTLGASGTLTVTLSSTQPTVTTIAVTTNPTGIVSIPATITVPANQLSAPILVNAVALGNAMVHVSLNGSMAESGVQVTPPPPVLDSLLPSPLTVVVGATGQLTVTLTATQAINTTVQLSVDDQTLLQVPPSVPVPANQTSASFTVTGLAVGQALITATVGTSNKQATVQVVPPPPQLVSLLPNPLPLQQGATGTLALTINAAQQTDTLVPLTNNAATFVQAPTSVTVPMGQTQVMFSVTGLASGNATLSATLNGSTVNSTVEVTPPPPIVTALGPIPPVVSPLTLPKGRMGILRVRLSRASTADVQVALVSNAPGVASVPASVPVPAGSLSAEFPVNSVGLGTATVTASLNGGSAAANVVVIAPELVSLSLAPPSLTVFAGETVAFTTAGTLTDSSTQDFSAQVTWGSSNQTAATITAAGVATTLAPGTTTITATASVPSGPIVGSTDLTVQTPPALTLTPASATVQIGQNQDFTVSSTAPAPAGGLTVSFVIAGNGIATVNPTSILIPAGQSTSVTPVTVVGTGVGPVTLTASAPLRNSATATITIIPGVPVITGFNPTSGAIGTVVTITGTSFNPTASGNQITFNGKSAIVTSVNGTGTSLVTTVPQGATDEPIRVTTPLGTATSAAFTVTTPNFSISALPAPLTIPSNGQAAFTISLTGTGGFTNLVALTVTGVPAGTTPAFSAPQLTAGQTALLTLVTNGTTPAGAYTLTVTAAGLLNGAQTTRTTTVNTQVLGAGATSLSGQVRDEDDKPVKGALVKLEALQVATDDGGNFLIQNAPVGADQLFFIDGGPASTPQHNLPIIPYKVTIVAGVANQLNFIPHLHFQKTTGMVNIANSSIERLVTDPEIPDFQLRIPAGATITGWDGQPNTQISVRQVPSDRTPLPPLPADKISPFLYMDYFGKPGGGTPSEPIPVTLPNDLNVPPGTQAELWYFDEAPDGSRPNQWAQYGTGTVSADGNQIVPDINPATGKQFGQPRFCCGAVRAVFNFFSTLFAVLTLGAHGGGITGGDPVDLATGVFVMRKTDLVLRGRLPIAFTRLYRTRGASAGPFGPGTSHSYDIVLRIDSNLRTVLLPGNTSVPFSLQPGGTFVNQNAPAFRGAVLTASGGNHVLRFKDGTTWTFGPPVESIAFLITQADRNGNNLTFGRSGQFGDLTSITDASGRQMQLSYTNGRITDIVDPLSRHVTYAYNSTGRLATVTDPENGVSSYTYDQQGRMLTLTDARGITYLTNDYDANGRVSKQTQADGSIWQFAYTVAGGIVTQTIVTDPRGNQQTTRFNGAGYHLSQTTAQGQAVTVARGAGSNLVQSTTDPLGRKTNIEYDANGNVTTVTDPNSQLTRFEYEPTFSRVTKVTDALNQVTQFTYDSNNGNLLTVKDPLNHTTTMTYNAFGQPLTVQGPIPSEPPTTFAYDSNGNLIVTTNPLGNQTQRIYDVVSRLTSLINPRGFQTQFRYDGVNRVTEIADARQGITKFSYDRNGNLLTVADAKNQVTAYTYDSMDRLATRKDALNRSESYQYDPAGNLSQFTDRKNQQTTFQYDALNRRVTATYPDSTVTFTYDSVGRLSRVTDSVTGALDFAYDVLDRLIQETTGQGTVTYQFDALGRRIQMTANGQAPVTYTYDAASRLKQVIQSSLTVGLTYNAAGRRTALTYPNGTNTTYGYDFASRLTSIVHNGSAGLIEALTYTYDAAGNRMSLLRANSTASLLPAAVASATYNAANEQIQFNSATPNLTYDANGNLQTQTDANGTTTYQWDARNRLTAITGPGLSASFVYDALGRRISKAVNGVTTRYLHDGNDIVQEIGGGAVGVSYIRSLDIDEPFMRQQSGGNEFYHTEALGSALVLSDVTGTAQTTYTAEPFGKTTRSGTSTNSFQYTGREEDGTGLLYYRARYYHPMMQRFMSQDPLKLAAGETNFYVYVGNGPLNRKDPLGLYEADVHYHLTLLLARQVGFDRGAAKAIATGDQALDDNPATNAFRSPLVAQYWHFASDPQIDYLWQQALGSYDLAYLGQYLHALQDSYSHDRYFLGWPGHALHGHAPDDVCNDLHKAEEMARDTYLHLRAYMMHKTGGIIPYEWDLLQSMVGRKIRILGGCGQ